MVDLLINLLASVIAGTAVWLAQFAIRRRRLDRERAFFGVTPGVSSLLVTGRHHSSPSELSVHRRDVAALVELATLVRECGGRTDLIGGGDIRQELGRSAEFCVGGPSVNPRTTVHLRAALHGLAYENRGFTVGGTTYVNDPENSYAVLACFRAPAPIFYLGGLSSDGNLAAAHYLAKHHGGLPREFCLVLRVREPAAYGTDLTEVAADVSDVAFKAAPGGED